MRRWNVRRRDTGQYYIAGTWGEEPEWFTWAEVDDIFRAHRHLPLEINVRDFDATEEDDR